MSASTIPYIGGFLAVSLSAWLPEKLNSTPWTPFVQFQYEAMHMFAPGLPSETVALRGMVWALGSTYRVGRVGRWNVKGLREGIYNGNSKSASYRVETGFEFNVPD